MYFANKYPRARIIAIEPERDNFELLLRNVSPYPQVTCIQAALWNEEGEISVVDPGLGSWGFMTEAVGQTSTEHRHSVRAVTIESLRRDLSLETIDILKVDIEGAEREVFSSAAGWITDVNAVIAELHEHMRPGASRRFYLATEGFPREWTQGENIYLSREGWLLPPPSLKPEGS